MFCCVPGFAFGRCVSFKHFWPLTLIGCAPIAIILQALCRLGGAALFRSSRPSSSWGFPFWRLGLTVRRSRPPTAAAELRALGLKGVTASPIRCIRKSRCLCQQCHYQKMELVLQAIPNKETCAFLTQMQSPQYREMEYVHLGGLSRGITA